jgi:rhodanese-related sulfurtransferase
LDTGARRPQDDGTTSHPAKENPMTARITRAQLAAEIAAGSVVVVETLGPLYYEDAHLPGAINIPHTQVAELAPVLLPDRDAAIVTYCSNSACRNSQIAASELLALGYANVRKYAEGKQDWADAGLEMQSGAVAA